MGKKKNSSFGTEYSVYYECQNCDYSFTATHEYGNPVWVAAKCPRCGVWDAWKSKSPPDTADMYRANESTSEFERTN